MRISSRHVLSLLLILLTTVSACSISTDERQEESEAQEAIESPDTDLWAELNEIAIVEEMVMMPNARRGPPRDAHLSAQGIGRRSCPDDLRQDTVQHEPVGRRGNADGPTASSPGGDPPRIRVRESERAREVLLRGRVGHPRAAEDRRVRRAYLDRRTAVVERQGRHSRLLVHRRVADGPRIARPSGPRRHGTAGIRSRCRTNRRLVRTGKLVPGRRGANAVLLVAVRGSEHAATAVRPGPGSGRQGKARTLLRPRS